MTEPATPSESEPGPERLDEMLEEIEGKNAALDQFAKDKLARTNMYDADEDADREEGERIDGLAVEYRDLVGEFDDLTAEQRTKLATDVQELVGDVEQRAQAAGYHDDDDDEPGDDFEPDDDDDLDDDDEDGDNRL